MRFVGLPVHLWMLFLVSYIQRTAKCQTMFEYRHSIWQILLSKVTKNTIITVSELFLHRLETSVMSPGYPLFMDYL